MRAVAAQADHPDYDLITTIFPRTWPKGQNAELIRASTLQSVDPGTLSTEDAEHVTAYFYRHASAFRIVNVTSRDPQLAELELTVDTVEDLRRLEQMTANQVDELLSGPVTRPSAESSDNCSA